MTRPSVREVATRYGVPVEAVLDPETPIVWSQSQVAKKLGVTPRHVRELTRTPRRPHAPLRVTYVGRLPRYWPADVLRYLVERGGGGA